jgi:hypothetical protein
VFAGSAPNIGQSVACASVWFAVPVAPTASAPAIPVSTAPAVNATTTTTIPATVAAISRRVIVVPHVSPASDRPSFAPQGFASPSDSPPSDEVPPVIGLGCVHCKPETAADSLASVPAPSR